MKTGFIKSSVWPGLENQPQNCNPHAKALVAEQQPDGGWAQLPTLSSDAYATGQAIYALSVGAGLKHDHPAIEHGRRYLVQTQLADGTWHVPIAGRFRFNRPWLVDFRTGRIRGFPQPPVRRWMALSLPEENGEFALKQ